MNVKWTEEQQRVIDTRDKNILVSAAAGSGKTAVLVARILDRILDEAHPVDIDRMLIVTFTNAAAAEMRERIRDALEKKAEEEPDNAHLQRQLVLVHNARITTIHSFCLDVLRNHFQLVGIDPAFRIADEGEVRLIEQDAVKEIIDEAYEESTPDFQAFLDAYVTGKSDAAIEASILQLYHFALGQPWPERWLQECADRYPVLEHAHQETGKAHGMDGSKPVAAWSGSETPSWLAYVVQETGRVLDDLHDQLQAALGLARETGGPWMYEEALQSDLDMILRLREKTDYDGYAEAFRTLPPYKALSRKKDDGVSEELRQRVQAMRSDCKEMLAGLRKRYYYDQVEVLQSDYLASGLVVRELVRLTLRFMERMTERKNEKNVLDFGDMEHYALKALVEYREDGPVPGAAAREYAELFEEIMIDEYQDSNLVQELILNSVAGSGRNAHNLFMVGDVKQSIYRFRLARPELFMEKYRTYRPDGEMECRIDLHRNFRSREEVLEGVNYIFRQIMTEMLGGISYDEDAALYPGAAFAEKPESSDDGQSTDPEALPETGDAFTDSVELLLTMADGRDKQKQEARMVAARIREIVGHALVWDKEQAAYRRASYRDIVVLLRTVSGWADVFGEVFTDLGIPCYTGSQKGYFSATEIRIVLSYLQILDNPMQDIPLTAVLRSAIGGFSDEELAQIRIGTALHEQERPLFYESCRAYQELGPDRALAAKLDHFFAVYESLREKCAHTPVHLLIWEILDVTGYGAYAQALPGGMQRKANLDMLVEKAIAYEATSYRGLYHFVRYIENLKKYEIDYGEASIGSEAADTVRIMSIHKSKGLEFPIVFVSGMGKVFNEADSRSRIVLHPEFGIACDSVDPDLRTRTATLLKKTIQQKIRTENLGEELRVLYVAMTRAKEKLILTGTMEDPEEDVAGWYRASCQSGQTLPYSWLSGASSYLDWVMPALLRHTDARPFLEEAGLEWQEGENGTAEETPGTHFQLRYVPENQLNLQEQRDASAEQIRMQQLLQLDPSVCRDQAAGAYLEHVFASVYPYEADRAIIGKLSVSELKKMSRVGEEEAVQELYQEETVVPLIPRFREEKETIVGAARGTIYHTFMENLDYSRKDVLEIQLEELISCGKMTREEASALRLGDIRRFLASGSGARMERAALAGRLYRERPFVLGVPADRISSNWNPEQTVLVQGIIDAWFIEDGELVVLDYKTDRVASAGVLVDRYRTQLDYYAMALQRMTGYRVRDRIIYSFYLGEDIVL